MNTSATTNQIHEATRITVRATPTGFRRRTMAGALLVMALTSTAVGFAAMSHADDTQIPSTDVTISAPAPASALPPLGPWLDGIIDRAFHPHLHCGYQRFAGSYRCDWY